MARKSYFIVRWDDAHISPEDRPRYWTLATQAVLAQKDKDLSKGIAADGKPLGRPSKRWLERRKSKMTLDGSGDRKAPLFQPGRGLSRVRSLLTGKPLKTGGVRVWWRFDSQTHAEFGEVLAEWKRKRGARWDVLGMARPSVEAAKRATDRLWSQRKAANSLPLEAGTPLPLPIERSTRRPTTLDLHSGDMAEIARASREGRFSGWRTLDELNEFWREGRPSNSIRPTPRMAPSVKAGNINRQIEAAWRPSPTLLNRLKSAFSWFWAQLGV